MPCGATNVKSMPPAKCVGRSPSHSRTRLGSPAIWRLSMVTGVGARGRVHRHVVPLDEVGQLRVGHQALDAELPPAQLDAVGAVPVAHDRLASEALLDRRMSSTATTQPSQPPPASERGPDGLAEGRLVGGRVVEHLDDLDVALVRQREDDVARAEPGVNAAVDRLHTDQLGQAGGRGLQAVVLRCIGDVVNSHTVHRGTRSRGAFDHPYRPVTPQGRALGVALAALSDRLVQHDGGGCCDVEGVRLAAHRDSHSVAAAAAARQSAPCFSAPTAMATGPVRSTSV